MLGVMCSIISDCLCGFLGVGGWGLGVDLSFTRGWIRGDQNRMSLWILRTVSIYQPVKKYFRFNSHFSCSWTTGRVVMYRDPCHSPCWASLFGQCHSLIKEPVNWSHYLRGDWPECIREAITLCSKVYFCRHLCKEETPRLPTHWEYSFCVIGHCRK